MVPLITFTSLSRSFIALGALLSITTSHVSCSPIVSSDHTVIYHNDPKLIYHPEVCERVCEGAWWDVDIAPSSVVAAAKSTGGPSSQFGDAIPGVSLEFYGSWVEVYGSFDRPGGSVAVEVDNVVTTVSTPNVGVGQVRGLLFRAELKAAGEHMVLLSWNGGRAVTFEKFVVGPVVPDPAFQNQAAAESTQSSGSDPSFALVTEGTSSDSTPPKSSDGFIAGLVAIFVILALGVGLAVYMCICRRRKILLRGVRDIESPSSSSPLSARFSRFTGRDASHVVIDPFRVPEPVVTSSPAPGVNAKELEATARRNSVYGDMGLTSPSVDSRLSQIMFASEAPPAYSDSIGQSEFDQESLLRMNQEIPSTSTSLTYKTVPVSRTNLALKIAVTLADSNSRENSPASAHPTRSANVYPLDAKVDPFAKAVKAVSPLRPHPEESEPGSLETINGSTAVAPSTRVVEPPPQLHLRAHTPFQMNFDVSTTSIPEFNFESLRKSNAIPSSLLVAPSVSTRKTIATTSTSFLPIQDPPAVPPPLHRGKGKGKGRVTRHNDGDTEMKRFSSHLDVPRNDSATKGTTAYRKEEHHKTGKPQAGPSRTGHPSQRKLSTFASFLPEMGED